MTNSMTKIEALKVAISRTKHGVTRINDVVRDVNTVWVEAGEPYPLPIGEYKRRAWLLADLERMLAQLVDEAHAEALEINKFRDEQMAPSNYGYRPSFRIMSQWEIKAFLAAAHAEALEMNDEYDIAKVNAARVQSQHCNASRERQERWLAEAHGEALEMNAETDRRHHCSVMASLQNTIMERDDLLELVEACHAEALEEDYRFNWLHNRWCLFHSSSRQQQEEIIAIAWEQAHQTIEAEEEYNSQRQWKLEAIWKHTHRDYKGESDGVRSILVCRNGTISVPLEGLTDKEIEQRSSMWQRNK